MLLLGSVIGLVLNDLSVRCVGRAAVSNVGGLTTTVNRGVFHRAGLWVFNVEPYNSNRVWDFSVNNAVVGFSNWAWLNASGPYFSCDVKRVRFSGIDKSGRSVDLPPSSKVPVVKACVASEVLF